MLQEHAGQKRDEYTEADGWISLEERTPALWELAWFMCADGVVRKGIGFGESEQPGVVYLNSEFSGNQDMFHRVRPIMWKSKDSD